MHVNCNWDVDYHLVVENETIVLKRLVEIPGMEPYHYIVGLASCGSKLLILNNKEIGS